MEDKEWVLKNVEEICANTRDVDEVCIALEHSTIFATEMIQNLTKTILDLQQENQQYKNAWEELKEDCREIEKANDYILYERLQQLEQKYGIGE